VRLGAVDPADFEARTAAAGVLAERGDQKGAAALFRALHADLSEKGRDPEALAALREAVRLHPGMPRDARFWPGPPWHQEMFSPLADTWIATPRATIRR